MRILIVDDVPDNIRVLSRMLADEGHQISMANNGRQALRVAAASTPDLILLDVMMPELDGYATITALKADPRLAPIPVIFITALADAEDEAHGLGLGAVDYITKPFKEAVVRARVRTHLELKRQRDILAELSMFDGLTGIPNRRALDARLAQEWRRLARGGDTLGMLMIDVDHFKAFNDRLGHLAGDDCLRRVALTLAGELKRAGDFIARYGGEEFVCLLPGVQPEGLAAIAEQLRAAVEAQHIPHEASPTAPWVTISLGAALCQPASDQSPTRLIDAADAQLYLAKAQGRNRASLAASG
ncbi:MAG TPA: diguanylate cyclase [Chromatiaceae bacterium]|nr:diguanylate cyclase [Chromatiaceae bacterium]